jgi:hypothetical protein
MPMIMHYLLERNHAFFGTKFVTQSPEGPFQIKKNMPSNVHFLLGRKFVNQLHTTS